MVIQIKEEPIDYDEMDMWNEESDDTDDNEDNNEDDFENDDEDEDDDGHIAFAAELSETIQDRPQEEPTDVSIRLVINYSYLKSFVNILLASAQNFSNLISAP